MRYLDPRGPTVYDENRTGFKAPFGFEIISTYKLFPGGNYA
jgi:hypothetical protein